MLETEAVSKNQNDTKKMLYILDFIMINASFVTWVVKDPLAMLFTIGTSIMIILTIYFLKKNKLAMVE